MAVDPTFTTVPLERRGRGAWLTLNRPEKLNVFDPVMVREIDEILYEHPKVLEAAAVGVPDPRRGETVKAFIVVQPGETLTEEEVIAFCKDRLAPYKVPRIVEFRDELPKSTVGKVLRRVLRDEELAKAKQA